VIQEGMNIPECGLIICFGGSVVAQGKDFVQLKGRARMVKDSKFVVVLQGLRDKVLFQQRQKTLASAKS
jgi:ERCC4-related helicase